MKTKYSENSEFAKIVNLIKNDNYYIRKVAYKDNVIIHEIVRDIEPGHRSIYCEVATNIAKALQKETNAPIRYDGKITNPINFIPYPVSSSCVRHLFNQ